MYKENKTKQIVDYYFSKHYQFLTNSYGLDLFGKDGLSQTQYFAPRVAGMDVFEINEEYARQAAKNLGINANVKVTDSIASIQKNTANILAGKSESMEYSLIIVDNPLSTYCDDMYCENFDVIEHIGGLFTKKAFVIMNFVHRPFNITKNPEWQARRQEFFGFEPGFEDNYEDMDNTSKESMVQSYISALNKNYDVSVEEYELVPREKWGGKQYLYHLAMMLVKK